MAGPDAAAAPVLDPMVPRVHQVVAVRRELPDTVTLDLAPQAGPPAPFLPGQFNMLYAFGVGEVAISLSGDCADRSALVHTIRDAGAVSGALARLEPGATLGVRGPFGNAWPLDAAQGADVLVIAGGLGLAPLRPAIYRLLAERTRYGRLSILFGTRTPEDMLFRHELEQWRQRLDVDVTVTVDHAGPDWHGHVGVVPRLIARASFTPANTVALVCGPEVMMRFTVGALRDAGVAPERTFLSLERNMKCAVGHCGHCQFGPAFICRDGPVFSYDRVAPFFLVREV